MTPHDIWHFIVQWTVTEVPARAKMLAKRAPQRLPLPLFLAITSAIIVLAMYAAIFSQGAGA